MGVFHVFKIVQMVPNRATHHKYEPYVIQNVSTGVCKEHSFERHSQLQIFECHFVKKNSII